MNGVENIKFGIDDDFAVEEVTSYIDDKDFLDQLSNILGIHITRLERKVSIDIALHDVGAPELSYPEKLQAWKGEDDFETEDFKKFGYAFNGCIFFHVRMLSEEFKVDSKLAFNSEIFPDVFQYLSIGIGVDETVDALNSVFKKWDGAKEVFAFHKGYFVGKAKQLIA